MMPHMGGMNPPPGFPQQQQQQQFGPSGGAGGGGGSSLYSSYTTPERSQRSVFVGNIPYEATEEDLRNLFSQVGPVVGFRLVFDRETGKSKGYGFCEYLDPETAASALRNLNGFEFHGRNLRIDTAAGDRSKEEIRQLQMTFGAPQEESPYGSSVEPAKAPEAIGRAVASLPPEQMFELMKQMKLCIQTNPNEARNMLLQNPQLAYALLQAQVVMRIVDPQVAMTMLHRENEAVPPIMPQGVGAPMATAPASGPSVPAPGTGPGMMPPPAGIMGLIRPTVATGAGVSIPVPGGDVDYRTGFGGPMGQGIMGLPVSSGFAQPTGSQTQQQPARAPFLNMPSLLDRTSMPPPPPPPATAPRPTVASSGAEDHEKAALIMQVLQLTDEQIAMLPPDQKQSVLMLREQLRSSQR